MSALGHKRTSQTLDPCPLYPRKRTSPNATAMSALCQKQTFAAHSITLSARTRNDSGIFSPIVFAVFRFTINSNLTDI